RSLRRKRRACVQRAAIPRGPSECRAVHREKRTLGPRTTEMDRPRDQFLPRSAFAGNQDTQSARLLELPNVLQNLCERSALAHKTIQAPTFCFAFRYRRELSVRCVQRVISFLSPGDLRFQFLISGRSGAEAAKRGCAL